MHFGFICHKHEETGIVADKAHEHRGSDAPWQARLRGRRGGRRGLSVHWKVVDLDPSET